MRGDRASALAHDGWYGHFRFDARGLHVRHDVGRVLFELVVFGCVKVGLGAVVVDRETAAHVDVAHLAAELGQLHIDVRRFLHRVLDGDDARDLAADMEVQQLQAVEHVALGQAIDDLDHLRGREPELGAVPRGICPTADALGRQFGSHAEQRLDAELFGSSEHDVDLLQAFEHHDYGFVELLRQERGLDVARVFEAVADDQPADLLHRGERDQKLGLGTRFEAEVPLPATRDYFFYQVALLVDLDREHAAIHARVLVLCDRFLERFVDQLDAVTYDVGEANQQWQLEPARFQILCQLEQVDGLALLGAGRDLDVPARVHVKVWRTPALDLVPLRTTFGRPFSRPVVDVDAQASGGFRIGRRGRKADVLCHWCFGAPEYSR